MAQSKSASFLFVEVSHTGKVPANREIRTSMQKHVMRDIGRIRKSRNRAKKIPGQTSEALPKNEDDEGDDREQTRMTATTNVFVPYNSRGLIGTGRTNPFARYPIDINLKTLFLLDHG
jgi:hypothetical protein